MKMFVVLAFAAAAVAEPEANADPQYLTYSAGVYHPYTTYGAYPYSTYSAYTPYGAFPYNTYNRHHFLAKREADADADPALVYNTFPYTYSNVAPVVNSVAAPVSTYHTVASPMLRAFATTATHQITNYNNPTQYTAESISAFGPKYIAKNGPVQHVVKREAEADPALVYSNVVAPYTTHHTSAVAAPPMIYNSVSGHNVVA